MARDDRVAKKSSRLPRALLIVGFGLAVLLLLTVPLLIILANLPLRMNLALGQQHIVMLQSRLSADERFRGVNFRMLSLDRGTLIIEGEVLSDEDALLLRELVEMSSPPVPVVWELTVSPTDEVPPPEPPTTVPTTRPARTDAPLDIPLERVTPPR